MEQNNCGQPRTHENFVCLVTKQDLYRQQSWGKYPNFHELVELIASVYSVIGCTSTTLSGEDVGREGKTSKI